ncbi:DUF2789 family protein [Pseudocolwellia sp. HL-MZ19]|uniref:DUF2789 family protein n=1 Tax=unclassified Pseudocolwellia TaxID=2848178 RepID=UPI003CF5CB8A
MKAHNRSLHNLFEQLGLASTKEAMETFITNHAPLDSDVALSQAEFWTPYQSAFIKKSKDDDSNWAEIVAQLDILLRDP